MRRMGMSWSPESGRKRDDADNRFRNRRRLAPEITWVHARLREPAVQRSSLPAPKRGFAEPARTPALARRVRSLRPATAGPRGLRLGRSRNSNAVSAATAAETVVPGHTELGHGIR